MNLGARDHVYVEAKRCSAVNQRFANCSAEPGLGRIQNGVHKCILRICVVELQ
jgi:hypothetical protein